MMTRLTGLLISAVVLLTACATGPVGEGSPFYRLPVGSVVVLHQDLAVPEGHARVFLQGGAVVAKTQLQAYYPHCNFEQRAVSDGRAVIAADRFTVTAVRVGEDRVVRQRAWVYAAALPRASDGEFDDDPPSMVNQRIDYVLESPRQPQVTRLTCHGGFDIPRKAEYPSMTAIRAVLGGLVTIELP